MAKFKPKQRSYETQRLILRSWKLGDFELWREGYAYWAPPIDAFDSAALPRTKRTRARFRRHVLRQREEARTDRSYIWNAFLKADAESTATVRSDAPISVRKEIFVGWFDVTTIARGGYQMANLGYFIINGHRGQGLAKEALSVLVPGAFSDLGFHRLEAVIEPANHASIHLAERAGLEHEGMKRHYWQQDGVWKDQVVYVATPEIYPSKPVAKSASKNGQKNSQKSAHKNRKPRS